MHWNRCFTGPCNYVCAAPAACELNEPDHNVTDLTIASVFAFGGVRKEADGQTFALNWGR